MPDVVLPVLDEAEALPAVLGSLPPSWRAIVVDNGSRDGSGAVAAELGAHVVTEQRRGFGAACYAGLCESDAEVVAFADADASFDLGDLPRLAMPITEGHSQMVLCARRPVAGAWPRHAQLANRYLAWRLRRHLGVSLTDIGPMRVAGREELLSLGIEDRGLGWPLEMVVRAAKAGWALSEVDVVYRPRVGRSKVTGSLGGTLRVTRDMHRVLRSFEV